MIYLCFHRTEFNQITPINEKRTSNNNFDNYSHRDPDIKKPQMTSNNLKTTQTNTKFNKKNKNILKGGSVQENIEINDQFLDEVLDKNDMQMDLAMHIIFTDKAVRKNTTEDLEEFISQCSSIQVKKGEQLVSMMLATKKAFNQMGNDIEELHAKNES